MPKSRQILRYVLAVSALILFVLGAIYLYQKQQLKINYLSFRIENANHSFIVPDIDRLVEKLDSPDDLDMEGLHPELLSAIQLVVDHKTFSLNRELASECFISTSQSDFTVVFQTSAAMSSLLSIVNEEFGIDASETSKGVSLNGQDYFSEHFGHYLAISTLPLDPTERTDKLYYGNADYVQFDENDQSTRHIISNKYHFRLWESRAEHIKGKGINHTSYFNVAPADFEQLIFFGSSRIHEDVQSYFESPTDESFAWLSNGVMYIRKGEWELLMAQQGDERDLSLMLEEQTLINQGDTSEINYFNIGNFKIMPFESNFNWTSSMSDLNSNLNFYTEYNNFNLLSNNIPAMRWFLGQVQLGNLVANNQQVLGTYTDCLPEKAHYASMEKNSSGGYLCKSRIYNIDTTCIYAEVVSGQSQIQMEGVEVVYDFQVDIVPSRIQAISEDGEDLILLNNLNELALYNMEGEKKWKLALSTPLVEAPQIVDFDNDGHFEVVLFQNNQMDVVNNNGKSLNGFPVMYGGSSTAGLAVNYDNKFKWRLIVNVGNSVKVYNEGGKIVEGWMFNGMNAKLRGKIYHVITEGKDIITFKDKSNFQHVLSRRGEYRLDHDVQFNLPNETDFVVGSLESALRKMGYANGFIYNYYILDGHKDSVAIDQVVTPIRTFWEYNDGKPLLIMEEPDRLLIVNQFGYVQSEVLKPNQSNDFVGLVGEQDYGFVFADNSQNSIYLLNNFGKMILPQAIEGSKVSIIEGDLLYTFSGISVKAYKIAD